ncbi:hypothetical protein T310_4686 [Rasamsonia emersonii CBS 393.64]|uniref:Uncharacterized protein n=1 Tax=Rasamsonia emersonii (strain ATCC 16479 / CBS 393.64 / IMI 116815) TaxID=1408163 RepID=A0A0F4YT97_RASE3|nr:hypothetical protein T310_4686 [Rasamsonia emersonii CBS 393.64]KKA21310.1 hypothetical protein T310_4686 [Rasamsonia emersonii CBS 393.64]
MSDNQQPQQQGGNPPSDNNSNNNNQQEDYLDKGTAQHNELPNCICFKRYRITNSVLSFFYFATGLDALERKFGHGKIDPAKMRDTNEKITDAVREGFEQWTGCACCTYKSTDITT